MNTGRMHHRMVVAAFTVVELLIVMGVIVLLLSILIVAVQAATKSAHSAHTTGLMNSIKQALVRFKEDVGYLPPVLGNPDPTSADDLRSLFDPRGPDLNMGTGDDCLPSSGNVGAYAGNVQEWFSITTPAEFLIGYGHHNQDGYGFIPPGFPAGPAYELEKPPAGIRHPTADGVWGATLYGAADGSLDARMLGQSANVDIGRVYGPYLELKDERLLASVSVSSGGGVTISLPGEGSYDERDPKVILDYWGSPIRYYRRPYAPGALPSDYRTFDPGVPAPTLSDIFLLRPYQFEKGSLITSPYRDADGDDGTTSGLSSAEFALLSAGPDRRLDQLARYDAVDHNADGVEFSNEDNIAELGP